MSRLILSDKGGMGKTRTSGITVFLLGDESKTMRKALKSVLEDEIQVIHVIDPDKIRLSNRSILMIDHAFDRSTLNLVSEGLGLDIPLLIGSSKRLPNTIWDMKTVAQARGSIFEVATRHEDYSFRIDSTLKAVSLKWHHSCIRSYHEWFSVVSNKLVLEPKQDELGSLPGVNLATQQLRSDSGRLNAEVIRKLFDLTRKDVAALSDVSAEAIRQTPDSKNLQAKLLHFEKIARLLVFLKVDDFRKWLNTPNDELDGHSPLQLIHEKRWTVIENLVADILENRGR